MNITFRQVDAFQTVVSTGTVTEAAAILGISQPAVSRLLSDFETAVGFQLFQRSGRVLVPTDEARLLVEEVRQAISGMEHIKDAAEAIGKFGHARLNLAITPGASLELAPNLIGEFASARPHSMVRMEIAPSDDAVEWMVSQNCDFGIATARPANPSFECETIHTGDVCCVVPTDHPLARRKIIHARDLEGESFISYLPSSRFRFEVDGLFDTEGVPRRLQYETRTTDAICRLVARGLGVSVVGASREYFRTIPGCHAVPFSSPLISLSVLFWSRNRPMSAVAKSFLEIVRSGISAD
ncbi:LysR substrate-binding domain-containing protein [Ovoidimarina sediminis]|uniref:LysR substrate-binding domain-containing protein n=1 Tax=Ovoidimarina sediminis TaxID=3079856 RepID=UPI00291338FD|nr:LysR substrate-binding domain-containing protein [Rhodophyticola sp. MJ-SS7]MDU8944117.1 LysR substrate-binding domain-containing protein [Rhodophyticola sp. MJ-SS7]